MLINIVSGMTLDRKNLLLLIKEIINYKINIIIISHKDRLILQIYIILFSFSFSTLS